MANVVFRISHKVKNIPPPLSRAVVADFFTSEGNLSEEGLEFIQSTYLCTGAVSKKDGHLIIKIVPQGTRSCTSRTKGPRSIRICLLCGPDDTEYGFRRIDRFSRHEVASIHRTNIAELLDISESELPGMRLHPCDSPKCRRSFSRLDQLNNHKKICGQVVSQVCNGSRTVPPKPPTPPPQLEDVDSVQSSPLNSPSMEQCTFSVELHDAASYDHNASSQANEASSSASSTEYVNTAEELYRYYFDRYICYLE